MSDQRGDGGQATVELALVLPLVVFLLIAVVQAGLLVRDKILVAHAAREAARASAVDPDEAAAQKAAVDAGPLDADRITVTIEDREEPGSRLKATVRYQEPIRLPLIGNALGTVTLDATATMRVEQ